MKKALVGFVLGALLFGSIGVYATAHILSKDISYTKKDGTTTSVDDVLNDLYSKVKSCKNELLGDLETVLVWENTSNSSSFASQTINYNAPENTVGFIVEYHNLKTSSTKAFSYVPLNGNGSMGIVTTSPQANARNITGCTLSSMTFGKGYGATAADNSKILPLRVYAVKIARPNI